MAKIYFQAKNYNYTRINEYLWLRILVDFDFFLALFIEIIKELTVWRYLGLQWNHIILLSRFDQIREKLCFHICSDATESMQRNINALLTYEKNRSRMARIGCSRYSRFSKECEEEGLLPILNLLRHMTIKRFYKMFWNKYHESFWFYECEFIYKRIYWPHCDILIIYYLDRVDVDFLNLLKKCHMHWWGIVSYRGLLTLKMDNVT